MANLKKIILNPFLYLSIASIIGATTFIDFKNVKQKTNYFQKEGKNQYKIEKIKQGFENRKKVYEPIFGGALALSLLVIAGKGMYNRGKERTSF